MAKRKRFAVGHEDTYLTRSDLATIQELSKSHQPRIGEEKGGNHTVTALGMAWRVTLPSLLSK